MNPAERQPELLEKIFFVPEEIELPATSINRYITELAAFHPSFQQERFAEYLGEFELQDNMLIHQLSFGQQKKVLLSAALASGCALILMDEPTNGLDIPAKMQFRRLVAAAAGETSTFVLSTHQIRELEQLIDPIVILHGGGIVLQQSLSAIGDALDFAVQPEPPPPGVVYSERTLGGYAVIRQPGSPYAATPDLELLFSAVVNAPNRIRAIFGRQGGLHE